MGATGVAARAGAAVALGLGLWLVGPQALGVAGADSGRGQSDSGPGDHSAVHSGSRLPRASAGPPVRLPGTAGAVRAPYTALRLQEIPVVGPLMVTPVVNLVNHIPMVSDVLHPVFGYPLQPDGHPAPRDVRVMSFDGTPINVHYMPAEGLLAGRTAPTVFLAPALGMPGATNIDGTPFDLILSDLGGEVGVADLRKAGYNVVTWDPRGEYFSGGRVEIDSPDFEARDVSSVINWVALQSETRLDGPGDPRMGMAGASYGGGIQLVTAAIDHRVDAIVPVLAWNTLIGSLYRQEAFKTASATALGATLVFTLARMNPGIVPVILYGDLTGRMTAAGQDLLARSGPGAARGFPDLVSRISAPTLLIQGANDTLTSLTEADLNAQSLLAQGVPTKVVWFCGGHGLCIHNFFDPSDGEVLVKRTVGWLDRYVRGMDVSTGPAFEWVDQRGQHLGTDNYPAPAMETIVAERSSSTVLPLVPFVGGSGPMFLVLPFGGTMALNAVNLCTPVAEMTTYIAGEPQVTLTYSGTGTGGHVYAQLVDPRTGLVIGNQVTPIPVTLDGQTHTVSVPLELVAHTLNPGEEVTLQLFSWSAAHAASWSLGTLNVDGMRLSLPTTSPYSIDPHGV